MNFHDYIEHRLDLLQEQIDRIVGILEIIHKKLKAKE